MEKFWGLFIGIIIISSIIGIILYILEATLLSKLNKLMYGKETALAWIPIANIYLLGKLTVNETVGWALLILFVLSGRFGSIAVLTFVIFDIYAFIKYIQLKNKKKKESIPTMSMSVPSSQPMNNKVVEQENTKTSNELEEKPEVYSKRPMDIPEESKNVKPSEITAVNPAKRTNMQSNPLQDLYGSSKKQN